ncbi:hypothetical protein FLB_03530 [Flavobacterium succinicans]|uniref:Uncharacterized protein n=1 Tax=Flavobacterium succinicans TaxID=29536 RepID=A0A199XV19_9FLAO|nr:hypothetical protein FLB_03530 [Flavobacterium succinicans]
MPNNLYCGIPIPTIKIKSTAAEIEQQLANTVEDVNGNKLVEVVLENGDNVPAIVGTEEGLEKIGKSNTKSIFANIDDYINSLTSKSARKKIRANIINLAESKDIAIAFFNNNKNSFEAIYKNDFDKWYDDVFLNGLKKNPAAFEAHHIIPVKVLEGNDKLKNLLFELSKDHPEVTFNFNEIDNGMMVQKKSIKLEVDGHGNHPEYDIAIDTKINLIIEKAGNEKIEAFNQIKKLIKDTKATLKNEVLLGTKNVNDIINF